MRSLLTRTVATLGCLVLALTLSAIPFGSAGSTRRPLLGEFGGGWREIWKESRLSLRGNTFAVVEDATGNRALHVESSSSASALWRALDGHLAEGARLNWRWRVEDEFANDLNERSRAGDDYRARVLVSFDQEPEHPDARALCYVWASNENVGDTFPNPHNDRVMTIVVQSGDGRSLQWVQESRHLARDFERAFGERPKVVTALGVIVDTDDTGARATTRFDDIVLDYEPAGF